jgi:hypothetical protein
VITTLNKVVSRSARVVSWALLLFCLFNWIYTQRGCWWVELASVRIASIDTHTIRKGLFSEQGVLIFANSHWHMTGAGLLPPDWKTRRAVVSIGGFDVGYNIPPIAWSLRTGGWIERASIQSWEHAARVHSWGFSKLGFTALWQPGEHAFVQRGVAIPWWFLTSVFAITPLRRLLAWWRARRSTRAGHCQTCGYDLRATPERCPECGRIVNVGAGALTVLETPPAR